MKRFLSVRFVIEKNNIFFVSLLNEFVYIFFLVIFSYIFLSGDEKNTDETLSPHTHVFFCRSRVQRGSAHFPFIGKRRILKQKSRNSCILERNVNDSFIYAFNEMSFCFFFSALFFLFVDGQKMKKRKQMPEPNEEWMRIERRENVKNCTKSLGCRTSDSEWLFPRWAPIELN